jgi:hypothetical protein
MSETRVLNEAQVATFRREGFVFVPGFFTAGQAAHIGRWIDEMMTWPEQPGRHMVYYEDSLVAPGERLVQRVEYFTDFHKGFARIFNRGRMIRAVAELFGEDAVLFKEKVNFKRPGGEGFKAHQDVQAGWNAYAGTYITGLVSIDPATLENGCLEVASGWHGKGLVGAEWAPLDGAVLEAMDFKPYPTGPGDALFFDSFAPHRSGPNLTKSQRRVLYVTYNRAAEGDQRERYFSDKRKSFPPDVEREPGKQYVFRV